MKTNKIYKTLAFLALLAEFMLGFMLFGKIRNLILEFNPSENYKLVYILIILFIIVAVFLFVLSIMASGKTDYKETIEKKEISSTKENSKKNYNEELLNHEELIDVENYIKKILPKENTKLDIVKYTEKILSNLAKEFDIVQGLFFVKEKETDTFNIIGKYAYFGDEEPKSFMLGETLSGQVAKNKTTLNLQEIPENFVTILSGLGSSSPNHLIIIPIVLEEKTIAIIELASFKEFKHNFSDLFEGLSEPIGKTLLKY